MTQERINRIEIGWRDLFKPITGLQTGPEDAPVINDIVVRQEIIPVIFVPGIMGSRLKRKGQDERAWDPDGKGFMLYHYLLFGSQKTRKKMLVGEQGHDSNYLEVDLKNIKHNKKLPDGMADRNWGGVFWKSYGKILKTLAGHEWPDPLHACFHLPVYAFGYNWTASNAESGQKLAAFIEKTIDDTAKTCECTQVILVTHSMGGLVAREACRQTCIQAKVLGVVHGVQPATGAPAAYFRMKTGFEPPADYHDKFLRWLRNPLKPALKTIEGTIGNHVLGNYGPDVTIILANSPGALELLPNKLYKDNNGSAQWLSYTDHLGKRSELPQSDPYKEIYGIKKGPAYRLVNPEWLGDNTRKGYKVEEEDTWEDYLNNLNDAEDFHEKLSDKLHPETYQFFATDLETVDRVDILGKRHLISGSLLLDSLVKKNFIMEIRDDKGENVLSLDQFTLPDSLSGKHCRVYSLKPPAGSGDGTVPDSSGRALKAGASGYTTISTNSTVDINEDDEGFYERKHDDIYKSKTAKRITLKAIENICKYKIKKETGAA